MMLTCASSLLSVMDIRSVRKRKSEISTSCPPRSSTTNVDLCSTIPVVFNHAFKISPMVKPVVSLGIYARK